MKHSVGIFSRQDKSDYAWLVELFSSSTFSDRVKDVRSTVISNCGFVQFIDDASKCSLGIIYHTKNRGRINITDIQGSLYDEELETLNKLLGRDNVIVVIDDVENNSHEEKIRIVELQPSIEKLACDLLLVSKTEKNNTKILMTKVEDLKPFHSASALQGGNTHRDPHSGRPNLVEKLTDTPKAKHKTEDSQPLHIPSTIYEVLRPLSSNRSPEVSFSDKDHETWSDYVDCKSIRESLTPNNGNEKYEMPSSNTVHHNKRYNYEDQNLPSNIDSLQKVCVAPATWKPCDIPNPQRCNEMSKTPYNSDNFKKHQKDDSPDIQFCNTTSETGCASEDGNIYETPDAWIANDRPEPELCNEMSNMCCSLEDSETLPEEECPAFNDETTEELPNQGCSPSAHKSPRHQSINENWSQVLDELKEVLKKPQQ